MTKKEKTKYFVRIFTPLGIYLTVAFLAVGLGFDEFEVRLIRLIWLLARHRYILDQEKKININLEQMAMYIIFFVVCLKVPHITRPIASMLSNYTYDEFSSDIMVNLTHPYLCTIVLSPIIEEWDCRISQHMAYKCFNNIYAAIIIQALLFGMMHFNWYQFFIAFVFGIFSGYVYHKHKNIKLCIAMHSMYNLIA